MKPVQIRNRLPIDKISVGLSGPGRRPNTGLALAVSFSGWYGDGSTGTADRVVQPHPSRDTGAGAENGRLTKVFPQGSMMKPFRDFPRAARQQIKFVLTDIDDTLTLNGKLPAAAYQALEDLQSSGISVVPITGRPAGWCDHIARMWPVLAVVGENGAFYFRYAGEHQKMVRSYAADETFRRQSRQRLEQVRRDVLKAVPGCRVSADQRYREADLAIDFCEDVEPLSRRDIDRIVSLFETAGATAKISSIHVNGWFGNYDKLTMTQKLFRETLDIDIAKERDTVIYIGDSPNDAPMFGFFPHSVGVANVLPWLDELAHRPTWVTDGEGGLGFAELAAILLDR
jgi:HAD superfamily hydrolase (TIGR01484 family)